MYSTFIVIRPYVCVGKMLPNNRLAVDNIYTDSLLQTCRGQVMLPVSKLDSLAAGNERVSLRSVDIRQVSFDQQSSSCNMSRFTGPPQSSWISWIDRRDENGREDRGVPSDEVTEPKLVCRTSDECLDDSLCERQRSQADGTSQCGRIISQVDLSGNYSDLSSLQQPSDVVEYVVDDWLKVEDDCMQLKSLDAGHLTSVYLSESESSPMSL